MAEISGLTVSHPALAIAFALCVVAIAGLPPFGLFTSEFLLATSTFARNPSLAVFLGLGLAVAFGALIWRLQGILFGEPSGRSEQTTATLVPVYFHLAIVLVAGIWIPQPIVQWFEHIARLLG